MRVLHVKVFPHVAVTPTACNHKYLSRTYWRADTVRWRKGMCQMTWMLRHWCGLYVCTCRRKSLWLNSTHRSFRIDQRRNKCTSFASAFIQSVSSRGCCSWLLACWCFTTKKQALLGEGGYYITFGFARIACLNHQPIIDYNKQQHQNGQTAAEIIGSWQPWGGAVNYEAPMKWTTISSLFPLANVNFPLCNSTINYTFLKKCIIFAWKLLVWF